MPPTHSIVISASRRTDIPAFFMPWFMQGIARGEFEVTHPFTRRVSRVVATAPPVHTIVFWSKNFGPFLEGGYGRRLHELGYHLYFQFTVNSRHLLLEPHLPGLDRRIEQIQRLCDQFGPAAVNWRFDPICFYRSRKTGLGSNLEDIDRIAEAAAAAGIRRCTTSFMDVYAKIAKRTARRPGFDFVDPSFEEKIATVAGVGGPAGRPGHRALHLLRERASERSSRSFQDPRRSLHSQRTAHGALRRPSIVAARQRTAGQGRLRMPGIGGCRILRSPPLSTQLSLLLRPAGP